jgi:hypothetical protein
MQEIPVRPVPSQTLQVVLDRQNVQILIYQKPQGLFVDTNVNGEDVATGIIAREAVPLISKTYSGFQGGLYFIDSQAADDPNYSGLGSRWRLIYLTADEHAIAQQ